MCNKSVGDFKACQFWHSSSFNSILSGHNLLVCSAHLCEGIATLAPEMSHCRGLPVLFLNSLDAFTSSTHAVQYMLSSWDQLS